jgi:hypothetical protein
MSEGQPQLHTRCASCSFESCFHCRSAWRDSRLHMNCTKQSGLPMEFETTATEITSPTEGTAAHTISTVGEVRDQRNSNSSSGKNNSMTIRKSSNSKKAGQKTGTAVGQCTARRSRTSSGFRTRIESGTHSSSSRSGSGGGSKKSGSNEVRASRTRQSRRSTRADRQSTASRERRTPSTSSTARAHATSTTRITVTSSARMAICPRPSTSAMRSHGRSSLRSLR